MQGRIWQSMVMALALGTAVADESSTPVLGQAVGESGSSFVAPDGKTIPAFEKLDEHRIRIGKVTVDHKKREVIVPAVVNMDAGLVEYILCLPNGKIHEALLVTEADPLHISLGMKALGFKSFEHFFPLRNENMEWLPFTPPTPEEYGKAYVQIKVRYREGDQEKESDLSDLVCNSKTKQTLSPDQWLYTNSFFYMGAYQASRNGDAIGIFADRGCTINYIGDFNDGDNDTGWVVSSDHPMTPGTPAEIVITQASEPESAPGDFNPVLPGSPDQSAGKTTPVAPSN
jgi:hypothetical protein